MILLSLISSSLADIAPRPLPNSRFTTYSVRIEGLETFPDVVVLLHQNSDTLHGHRVFTADQPQQQIANGGRSRGNNIDDADLFVVSKRTYVTWKEETSAEISRQREACRNGEGCAHISRFTPKYPPPSPETACQASIEITTSAPADAQDAILDTFQLTAAADGVCSLQGPARTTFDTPPTTPVLEPEPELELELKPEPEPEDAPPSALSPESDPASGPRCAAVTMSGSSALALVLVLAGAVRRRRYPDGPSRSDHGDNTARRTR